MPRTYTTRDFRCIPCALLYHPHLSTLTSFQRDVFWSSLIAQDDQHCLPFDAAILRSIIFPTRPSVNVGDVAAARDRLIAVGAYVRKSSPRVEWLEITPSFRHERGRHFSYGDEPPEDEQGQLPFGPSGPVPRPPNPKPPRRRRPVNGGRSDSDEIKQDESPPADPGNRAQERGKDSGRFARTEHDHDEDDWRDLCRAVGALEMRLSGALWESRWRTQRATLRLLVQDWLAKTPAQRAEGGGNAGAWLTAMLARTKAA